MKKFYVIACNVLWREISYYASLSENTFLLRFLKQGLHNQPKTLRDEVQKAIDEITDEYDAVLLGYGLCGKGIEGVEARNIPLVLMRGHDCITYLLGSKELYKEYFNANPGTYWFSPGWIETSVMPGKDRYGIIFNEYKQKFDEETALYLMESEQAWLKQYSTAAYVDLGVGSSEQHKKYTIESAEYLGWKTDFLTGNPDLMKRFLNGEWDSEDFLIVNPGEKITASPDDKIFISEK